MQNRPIGVFDSGLGGVSILCRAMAAFPHETFLYYGDSGNAPYGVRTEEEIRALTLRAGEKLVAMGIKLFLVACNTATGAAYETLCKALPVPVVGVEPAIVEAARLPGNGRVFMLATEATTRMPRYLARKESAMRPERIVDIPCPGEIVRRIERGVFTTGAYDDLLHEALGAYHGETADAVVLGCTHYAFIQEEIRQYMQRHFQGDFLLTDGGAAAVEAVRMCLQENGLLRKSGTGGVSFESSGDTARMQTLFNALLHAGACNTPA